MKNIILIHGYNGIPKIYDWLNKELSEIGCNIIIPNFPTKDGVKVELWKSIFDKYIKEINENTIIVAHSIGNEFIIKYLSEINKKVKMYIGLAGFSEVFECEGKEDLNRAIKEFLVTEKEINKFIGLVNKRHCIYSNDDHIVPYEVLKRYSTVINAEPQLIMNIGHMGGKSGLEKIPEVLDIIKNNM